MFIFDDRLSSNFCLCGSKKPFTKCCGVYLQGKIPAPTAEKLMRSRYSAYCLKNIDYLFKTEHPSRHKPNTKKLITITANSLTWMSLTIVNTVKGQIKDDNGIVEFIAVYQEGKSIGKLHERSHFIKEQGQWFYTDNGFSLELLSSNNSKN